MEYDYKGQRRREHRYGDVVYGAIPFKLKRDTLLLFKYSVYRIERLTTDTLVVAEVRSDEKEMIRIFVKSKNQTEVPIPVFEVRSASKPKKPKPKSN